MAPSSAVSEILGRIEARLGDAEMAWNTITGTRGNGTMATASLRLGPRLTELHIEGFPGADFTSQGVLSLDLRYLTPYSPDRAPLAVDILYMPDGMGGPFWTSDGASMAPVVRVLSLDVWGAVGRVDALFAADLCLRPIISSATDPDTCRALSGRVETELFVGRGRAGAGRPGATAPVPGARADRAR